MAAEVIAYSDNVCPFCCIGARRLKKLQQELSFTLTWLPFELHPEVPAAGISMHDYFGGKGEELVANVVAYGKDVGLKVNTRSLYNSRNSLKVNEYAKQEGLFVPFHQAIFKAYLEEDQNIGDLQVLLAIAESAGLNPDKAKAFISHPQADAWLTHNRNEALRLGITSVPSFIIGHNLIKGAYPLDTLRQLFAKALAA